MQVSIDHMEMMDFLTDEQRGILLRLVFDYFRDEKTKENVISEISGDNKIILPIFAQLATSIDRGRSAYIERCKINSENGKKGGAPKGNQNARKRKENDDEEFDDEELDEVDYAEEFFYDQCRTKNNGIALMYSCLSDELNKNGMSFSIFFDFAQLCKFFVLCAFISFTYNKQKFCFNLFLVNGLYSFVEAYNELGADGLLEDLKNTLKRNFAELLLENGKCNTIEESEQIFDKALLPSTLFETVFRIMAETDDELRGLVHDYDNQNNRAVE